MNNKRGVGRGGFLWIIGNEGGSSSSSSGQRGESWCESVIPAKLVNLSTSLAPVESFPCRSLFNLWKIFRPAWNLLDP